MRVLRRGLGDVGRELVALQCRKMCGTEAIVY